MKKLALLSAFVFTLFSCSDHLIEEHNDPYLIVAATDNQKSNVQNWLSNSNSLIEEVWDISDLMEISYEERYLYTALDEFDEQRAISFVFDESNSVDFAFVTESIVFQEYLLSRFYDLDGNLELEVKWFNSGEVEIESFSSGGRVEDYWSNASDCFSKFHTFTGNSIVDWGITAVFNAASSGLYSPIVVAGCLAAAPAMK